MSSVAPTLDDPVIRPVRATGPGGCRVSRITPADRPAWDRFVAAHPDGTVFHTIAWHDAVRDTFGHEAFYFIARRDTDIAGVFPLFLMNSLLGGRMLISVPYGVGGGILADSDETAETLFQAALQVCKEQRCSCIDMRSERAMVPDIPTGNTHVGFRRELPDTVEGVLQALPRKARAAARNARDKYRLTITYGDDQLHEVWRLYSISMRRLASVNYPRQFFERVIEYTPGRHWVSIVRHKGRPVAGLVTLLHKDRVMPYFLGTTSAAKRCSAANFIYLCAMERGVEEGYRVFDFGRTRRDNSGSFDFKRFQGFAPRPLEYQIYIPPNSTRPNLSPANPRYRLARTVWPRLPLWLTRPLGAHLSGHIPG